MDSFETAAELQPKVQSGITQAPIKHIAKILRSLPKSPYHIVLKLDFTNDPKKVAKHFDKFLLAEKDRFSIAAVYTETNGFEINPDEWFFDVFAYDIYGGHEDYDWLGDWNSEFFPYMTLTGMESLQEVYAADPEADKTTRTARDFCSLLVICKFQDLIRRSVPLMRRLKVPLLATAHDFTLIAEFKPA